MIAKLQKIADKNELKEKIERKDKNFERINAERKNLKRILELYGYNYDSELKKIKGAIND